MADIPDIPWAERVTKDGRLEVYRGPALGGGPWAVVFKDVLRDLNALLKQHKLTLSFVAADSAPAPKGTEGADVAVEVGSKHVSTGYEGDSKAMAFDGAQLHGRCFSYQVDGKIEKAFVFLPDKPQINTPSGLRAVGPKVMLVIAAHELLHAAGLIAHTDDDLMIDHPNVNFGSKANDDKIIITGPKGKGQSLPPLYLTGKTLARLKQLWGPKEK